MTEAQRAAQRLLLSMPRDRIKTHYRRSPEVGSHGGHARLPVEIDGVTYPSIHHAARALGMGRQTVRNMVRTGTAILR